MEKIVLFISITLKEGVDKKYIGNLRSDRVLDGPGATAGDGGGPT